MTLRFQELLNTNMNYLQNLALHFTKDRQEADDLFQETMMKLLKNANSFKIGTNFKGWSSTIMRNNFINMFRRNKRRTEVLEQSSQKAWLGSGVKVANDGAQNMDAAYLKRFIAELDDLYRIPFMMRQEGYRYAEIAEKLGVPIGTVKGQIYWARKKLQHRIATEL